MGKSQKVYTKEFKEKAARLAQNSGESITQVARKHELVIKSGTV